MYYIKNSEIYRKSDDKLIAPCQSVDDPDYIEYINWINLGGIEEVKENTPKSITINSRNISVQVFRDRFTNAETAAFITRARTDDNVATLQFKLSTAQEPLDLDGSSLQQGMLYLVAIGVLTDARRIEILS